MSFANSLNYVNLLSLEDYFFEQTDGAGMAHHSHLRGMQKPSSLLRIGNPPTLTYTLITPHTTTQV